MQAIDTTTRRAANVAARFELWVVSQDGVSVALVPPEGELVIGRGRDADLFLEGRSVSRRHAVLRSDGPIFTIEDLGSANGTIVGGRRAPPNQPITVGAGESWQIGSYVLVVQAETEPGRARHVWTHEYFEARIVELCARPRADGRVAFEVLGIRFDGSEEGALAAIAAELGARDVVARLERGVWAVLLSVEEGDADVGTVRVQVERALVAAGIRASLSRIGYPRDVTSAGAVMARLHDRSAGDEAYASTEVILQAPGMCALYRQVEPVARGELTVLILGETGVGKDLLAKRIHDRSARAGRPFLRLNCSAFSEPLLASELFGHERGAFTGAISAKPGLLETAAGGTVFLDEVGELPPSLQPKLLQVLESHEVIRVGGLKHRTIDVRFVAATNRDLEHELAVGRFRADLYYRLAGFVAHIPPLRERREEILPLAREFIRRARHKLGQREEADLAAPVAELLREYSWPGNVRELRNVIERAAAVSEGGPLTLDHLPEDKMRGTPPPTRTVSGRPEIADLTPAELEERQRILDVLAQTSGNQSRAAEALGWSRSRFLNRLNTYRLRPRRPPPV